MAVKLFQTGKRSFPVKDTSSAGLATAQSVPRVREFLLSYLLNHNKTFAPLLPRR